MRLKLLIGIAIILAGTLAFFIVFQNSESMAFSPELSNVPSSSTPYAAFASHSELKIQFFGDIMLDRHVAKKMGNRGLSYIFKNIDRSNLLGGSDITIANLEGPFAPYRVSTTKAIAFRFDPKYAEQLKQLGFSGFSLANNHSYDMGSRNVAYTRSVLEKNGLHWFGDELKEGETYTWVATSTTGSTTVAFLGLHNTYHEPDLKKVEAALRSAKEHAEYVIVNVHWGVEYKPTSTPKQQKLARWLIDHGATAVIGHHPHVIEEAEVYKDRPIFYSLGNFIFDQYFSTSTQHGLSVGLVLSGGNVTSAHVFPFGGVQSVVVPLTGAAREGILNTLNQRSRWAGKKFENGVLTF
jgi:poly-gamma-glutamate synthesis protein (capsule biosynthesis protein)